MLGAGERRGGLGGPVVTAIISVLAAWTFGAAAWTQFGVMPDIPAWFHVTITGLFAFSGAGIIWAIYGVIRLLGWILRKARGG